MRLFAVIYLLLPLTALAGQYNAILDIGDPMPGFTQLPTTSDERIDSKQIRASVLVLVSLANHCPWVRGMDRDLVALAKDYRDKDVKFIGFSVNHREDDRLPAMKQHAKDNNYPFTYMYDESQDIGRKLGATRTPEYFVFDSQRRLVYMGLLYDSPAKMNTDGSVRHINGEPRQHYVRDAIDATLAGKPVSIPETRAHGCTVKYIN
jgi:thiol-disulfide isomerase/thioredoxin